MALNIRKVTAQRAENNQIIKDNFYIISIEIVFFTYPDTLCPSLFLFIRFMDIIDFLLIQILYVPASFLFIY